MPPDEKIFAGHWLYEWMDEEDIRTPGDYMKAIRKTGSLDRLRELSSRTYSAPTDRTLYNGSSVVAGQQLDLPGFLSCTHFDCLVPMVNSLFGRLRHYFDSIVIDEVTLDDILSSDRGAVEELLHRVKLLLYLRNIGADKYVQFTHKISGMCSDHFREYAKKHKLGIDAIFDEELERAVAQKLTSEGEFIVSPHEEGWHYDIRHPDIGIITRVFSHSDMSRRPGNEEIARDAFGGYCCGLIRDVSASRALSLPLVQAAENDWSPQGPQRNKLDDRAVALNLRLPVLRNAPIKEILKFRDDNYASFEVFRAALRQAVREQIKQQNESGDPMSAEQIANAVIAEYLRPELAKIEVQLGGVKKTLQRKLNDNVAVAGATVGVGLIEHIPIVFTIVGAAVAASVADIINKRSDDKREIENSDLYFLWKARTRSRRH
jgi:hypothetical protein